MSAVKHTKLIFFSTENHKVIFQTTNDGKSHKTLGDNDIFNNSIWCQYNYRHIREFLVVSDTFEQTFYCFNSFVDDILKNVDEGIKDQKGFNFTFYKPPLPVNLFEESFKGAITFDDHPPGILLAYPLEEVKDGDDSSGAGVNTWIPPYNVPRISVPENYNVERKFDSDVVFSDNKIGAVQFFEFSDFHLIPLVFMDGQIVHFKVHRSKNAPVKIHNFLELDSKAHMALIGDIKHDPMLGINVCLELSMYTENEDFAINPFYVI